jgi:uncharacterized iron-regulated protein
MRLNSLMILLVVVLTRVNAQDLPAYKIYSSEGKPSDYSKMIDGAAEAGIVFVGELHNNSIAHWLELKITESIYAENSELVLAMEMFEADDQIVLTEYLDNVIKEDHLLKEAKVWNNYKTDYKPLVEFARKNQLPVIASNIPRRYANLVYRQGLSSLDSLTSEAKQWIAPLPIKIDLELPGYKSMIAMMGSHGDGDPNNIVYAQAVKDATMAHFILQNKTSSNKVLHFNGSYHSQNHEGIVWYIKQSRPDLKVITIQLLEQKDISTLDNDNLGKADFIIVIPSDMTKTY